MARIKRKFIEDDAINGQKIKLDNDQFLRARNAADTADVNILKVNSSDEIVFSSTPKIGSNQIATLNDIPTTFRLQGNWNASTNTPTLTSSVNPIAPLEYPMYIVSVAGNTTLNGYSNWEVGDKLYFANGQWYKVDNNDAVVSVNGQNGVVSLDTDDISEGSSNLYHTSSRVLNTVLTGFSAGPNSAVTASDTVLQGLQKLQGQINSFTGEQVFTQSFTLVAADITNQYVTLSNTALKLHMVSFGGIVQTPSVDYSLGTSPNNNRVLFSGDIAALAAVGDVLVVTYTKE